MSAIDAPPGAVTGTIAGWWRGVRTPSRRISLSPASKWFANWAGYFSPSQLNPLELNPLRDLIESQIDFERLRSLSPFKLFVGATQASTGKLRVFRERELTADMLLASACLPKIHHAVEIDGEAYWDGGASPPTSCARCACSRSRHTSRSRRF